MATLMSSPPPFTKYTFQKGDTHQGVWAIQRGLNSLQWLPSPLIEDGVYGQGTVDAVARWQKAVELTADGVFGPASQKRFLRSIIVRTNAGSQLPAGLVEGISEGESGSFIAAVNTTVDGGVDCGYTQRRVYEPYEEAAVKRAFDSLYQLNLLVTTLVNNYTSFYNKEAVATRKDRAEYAWRLATLNHNWPYGADRLANGYQLSTKAAPWVPDSAPDWAKTYTGWAKYYSMGSKQYNWSGLMTQQAFGVPADG
jgi:peptidoglycan hydrolase-like protein with peptidoglycan-binding domain